MILNFYNNSFHIRWQARTAGRIISGKCAFAGDWQAKVMESLGSGGADRIRAIGYFLHHGGEYIKNTVSLITPENFNTVIKCVKFLPEYNDLTCKIAAYWMKRLPKISHVLFCDTAFFARLPYEAKNYAIPCRLQQQDVRRYGRYGLSHLWMSNQVGQCPARPAVKLISVYLGDHTNVAAMNGKNPMATSFGFTPVEGILSANGSGSIDPTIIFYLHAAGMSFKEINEMLSQQSGFAALLGNKAGFQKVFSAAKSRKAMAAREFYCYNVAKWIGSFTAVLGGLDVLAFFSEKPRKFADVISEVCGQLAFLGLKCGKINLINNGGKLSAFSKPSSPVKTYCFQHDKWRIMEESLMALLKKGGLHNEGKKVPCRRGYE